MLAHVSVPDGLLQTLRNAVKHVPRGKSVEVPVEVLAQLLDAVVERRLTPIDESAASHVPTAEDLAEHGHGEITVEEAARMLGITNQAVQYAARVGKLKSRRIGKRVLLIDVASVRAYRGRGADAAARDGAPTS